MCTGMKHCVACESRGSNEDIVAYTEGRSHIMPEISDGALRVATQMRRYARFSKLMADQDRRAISFPEFQKHPHGGRWRGNIVTAMRNNFEKLVEAIPEFAKIVAENPHQPSPNNKGRAHHKHRRKAIRLWKRQVIQKFIATDIRALEKMLDAVAWTRPWWLEHLQNNARQQLQLAA